MTLDPDIARPLGLLTLQPQIDSPHLVTEQMTILWPKVKPCLDRPQPHKTKLTQNVSATTNPSPQPKRTPPHLNQTAAMCTRIAWTLRQIVNRDARRSTSQLTVYWTMI